jgi:hypothetical protein
MIIRLKDTLVIRLMSRVLNPEFSQVERRVFEQPLPHGDTIHQTHAAPPQIKHQTGVGHDAQAAELDQRQNDRLTEGGEKGAGVHHDQAGDAGSRCCREQGIDP